MKEPIYGTQLYCLAEASSRTVITYQKEFICSWYLSAPRDLKQRSSHGRTLQWGHITVDSNKACTTPVATTFHSTHIFIFMRSNTKNLPYPLLLIPQRNIKYNIMLQPQTFSACRRPHSVRVMSSWQEVVKWVIIRKSLKATHSIRWMNERHATSSMLSRFSIIHASNSPVLPLAVHPRWFWSLPQAGRDNSCRLSSCIRSTMCCHIACWHFPFMFVSWFSYKQNKNVHDTLYSSC